MYLTCNVNINQNYGITDVAEIKKGFHILN